ncbi:CDP-glucose 4,6-dehydratase [Stappia sp. F7233]|uniref:CDP-glucose 4,6-dehydratase n=1 Tax=Stappia albiluteola TaxID=2758565 RepID=A0A839AIG4_9HYPH|nr:CDP-glucose 4,6-dehydratase [Stappia albiluteola]MBA5778537.1 CDP-glucose 4,6-dehydratase [Stappia albiluteola]
MRTPDAEFWRGRRVLVTGHTGFKGSWAVLWLKRLGAHVSGLALEALPGESLFSLARVEEGISHHVVDIRDREALQKAVAEAKPEIVLHMAAQALVLASYEDPIATWESNVFGTLNLLECLKAEAPEATVLAVTSDKVYRNDETGMAFAEDAPLGGHDPYSASKAACEILVASWRDSFAGQCGMRLASARAGNVIGGGDFAKDRIIPDIWRSIRSGRSLELRNPAATRPWQHVLDCLNGYLLFIEAMATKVETPDALNFGPDTDIRATVQEIAEHMLAAIHGDNGWHADNREMPREMMKLSLDSSLARTTLGWRDSLAYPEHLDWTANWYKALAEGADMRAESLRQIETYMEKAAKG